MAASPSVTVNIVGTGELSGNITVEYIITNPESLLVDLVVEFDAGSGFNSATLTGNIANIDPGA